MFLVSLSMCGNIETVQKHDFSWEKLSYGSRDHDETICRTSQMQENVMKNLDVTEKTKLGLWEHCV